VSYSVSMIQCSNTTYTVEIGNNYQGFPRPFRYYLLSAWVCLGTHPAVAMGFNNSVVLGSIGTNRTQVSVHLIPAVSAAPSIDAHYNYTPSNVLQHLLVSVDGVGQIAQVYANDVPLALSSGGWTGPPGTFDISGLSLNTWIVTGAGSTAPGSGVGDLFVAAPASFFDLTVTANRRKFINADLTPVDLGPTATAPLGIAPQIWLTGRSGTPADFAINHGSGGSTWTASGPLAYQAAGTCVAPTPPPGATKLAMDNVIATATATLLPKNLISLRWSDDRGHSWGSPVTQDIGEAGEYRTSLQWQRLAYARDRVFEISWSVPMRTALQGCWIDVTPAQS
jgi:hypothetical protein